MRQVSLAPIFLLIFATVKGGKIGNGELHPIQEKLIEQYNPQPLLDTIKEEEKYGNTMNDPVGQVILAKIDVVSKVINKVGNFPKLVRNRTQEALFDKLNYVGARLVGLEEW